MKKFKVGDLVRTSTGGQLRIHKIVQAYQLVEFGALYDEAELELVKEEPKMKEWCQHLQENIAYNGEESIPGGYAEACPRSKLVEKWRFCPICGAERPKETVSLEDVLPRETAQTVRKWLKGKEGEIEDIIKDALIGRFTAGEVRLKLAKQILKTLGVE